MRMSNRVTGLALSLVALALMGGCNRSRDQATAQPSARATTASGTVTGVASGVASAPSPGPGAGAGVVLKRAGYVLTYPADWKLDSKDEDFDLDSYFSIDAPGACHVSFFFFAAKIDDAKALAAQRTKAKESVFKREPTETRFSTWGSLTGKGSELHGPMKPVGTGRMRSFVFAEPKRSVLISEFCFDDELAATQPGFDLIAKSFKLL